MFKLNLAILALLCLALTSCDEQEDLTYENLDMELSSRSANTLSITYASTTGFSTTVLCDDVTVSYFSTGEMLLNFGEGTDTVVATSLSAETSIEKELELTLESEEQLTVDDLFVEVCASTLCYADSSGNTTGQSLGFIIEDEPVGI